jgi:hypothetical protein
MIAPAEGSEAASGVKRKRRDGSDYKDRKDKITVMEGAHPYMVDNKLTQSLNSIVNEMTDIFVLARLNGYEVFGGFVDCRQGKIVDTFQSTPELKLVTQQIRGQASVSNALKAACDQITGLKEPSWAQAVASSIEQDGVLSASVNPISRIEGRFEYLLEAAQASSRLHGSCQPPINHTATLVQLQSKLRKIWECGGWIPPVAERHIKRIPVSDAWPALVRNIPPELRGLEPFYFNPRKPSSFAKRLLGLKVEKGVTKRKVPGSDKRKSNRVVRKISQPIVPGESRTD